MEAQAHEWFLVKTLPLRILPVLFFAWFYTMGGRSNKWLRRWLGGSLFGGSICVLAYLFGTFSWWMLIYPPALTGALTLGYGGDHLSEKLLRRSSYGFVLGLSALVLGLICGHIMLSIFQLCLALFASLYLGVLNPMKSAVEEEGLIAILSVICVPFMV